MFSLKAIFNQNKLKILGTFMMVILELISNLLFPLFMGFAINDLMDHSYDGLFVLSGLTVFSVIVGSLRRFYDSRIYGTIYMKTAEQLVISEQNRQASTSQVAARVGLLNELVEFFENGFPTIVDGFIGVVGTVIILLGLNIKIGFLCMGLILVITVVYGFTSKLNMDYHSKYNDQLEVLVNKLDEGNLDGIRDYFKKITRVNIKLSDLETYNFSAILLLAMSVFIVSMFISVESDMNYGQIFALLMYVFEFIGKVVVMPLYYQNYLRLREISNRLSRDY